MKKEEYSELNSMKSSLLDNIKKEVKNHKVKYIMILIAIILLLAFSITLVIIVVNQSNQINDLKSQTNLLNEDHSLLQEKAEKFESLLNEVNETKIELLEKESEINELQIRITKLTHEIKDLEKNIQEKDEEISKQATLNFDSLNGKLTDLEKNYNLHKEEFLKQNTTNYILLNESLNALEKELKLKDEEHLNQSIQQFNLLNNSINQFETDIRKLDYNLSFLVKYNIRVLADFYIDNAQVNLCSTNTKEDKIDDSRMKLMIHNNVSQGCYWEVVQNGNSFEFTQNSKTDLNGWKITIFNDYIVTTKTTFGSTFSFEQGTKYKYYKIRSIDTGKYLQIDLKNKRDNSSYFIDLVNDKEVSTDFMLKIS
jgi:hypothetical protein